MLLLCRAEREPTDLFRLRRVGKHAAKGHPKRVDMALEGAFLLPRPVCPRAIIAGA